MLCMYEFERTAFNFNDILIKRRLTHPVRIIESRFKVILITLKFFLMYMYYSLLLLGNT